MDRVPLQTHVDAHTGRLVADAVAASGLSRSAWLKGVMQQWAASQGGGEPAAQPPETVAQTEVVMLPKPDDCPGCGAREAHIADQRLQISALSEQLAAAKRMPAEMPADDVPSLGHVVKHCESGGCQEHADDFRTLKLNIMENAAQDKAWVTAAAQKHGLLISRVVLG